MFKTSFLVALTASATLSASMAFALEPNRSLTKVTGDVYRFQNNRHYSLVTVTGAGVVVVDSINADAASWLKENLSQITEQPITHLIYSHSHLDHASGGAALEAANVIAQANAPAQIDGVAPTMRFEESAEVSVGDKTFELTYLGVGHGEDLIAVIVRPENVAFITDVAAPKRLPFRTLPSSSPDDWIKQAKKADTLDFDIFAPAHGNLGTKADLGDAIVYLETLRADVLEGLKDGQSVAELQANITMEPYKEWLGYGSWRAENVLGMAEHLIKIDAAK
jgi:glyoxylase-like metal-dependent hydrolase (beta-lactamase superfamily II)